MAVSGSPSLVYRFYRCAFVGFTTTIYSPSFPYVHDVIKGFQGGTLDRLHGCGCGFL